MSTPTLYSRADKQWFTMSSGLFAWQVYIKKNIWNLFVDRNHHIHDFHNHGPDHDYDGHDNSLRRSPALSHALVAFGPHLAFQSPTEELQMVVFKTNLWTICHAYYSMWKKASGPPEDLRALFVVPSSSWTRPSSCWKHYFEEIIVDKKNKMILFHISQLVFYVNVYQYAMFFQGPNVLINVYIA